MTKTTPSYAARPKRSAALGVAAVAIAMALQSTTALAGGTIEFGEGKSVSLGLGMRASISSYENGSPDGSREVDADLNSFRVYMSGKLSDTIKGTMNFDKNGDTMTLLDGYAQFEFADEFNIWVGRMLPPNDRANMDGPYYMVGWNYPTVSAYPSIFAGRDDGATVWGKLFEQKLTYAIGAFKGRNRAVGLSNETGNPLIQGRITYNFLDVEPNPAYYLSSTYYGSVDVFSVGIAAAHQDKGVGTRFANAAYNTWSVDALFEKNLGAGTITLEGAFYNYATDYVVDPGAPNGQAYLLGAAYLLPEKIGAGMVQPFGRYQGFEDDFGTGKLSQYDIGINYIIDGHNARVTAVYQGTKFAGGPTTDDFVLGIQLQF